MSNKNKLLDYLKTNVNGNDLVFDGGRISTFSAKLGNDPINFDFKKLGSMDIINILKYEKVVPSLPKNYSGVTENYLYCYIDPFRPAATDYGFVYKLPLAINGSSEIRFGFEPFYIGKGISSTGHRFNQHLANFRNKDPRSLENPEKQKRFKEIEFKMHQATNNQPRNWDEYKKDWIKIVFQFKDRQTLDRYEKVLINAIGSTNGLKKGPLVNISNTK